MKREYNEIMDGVHMSDECAERILAQASARKSSENSKDKGVIRMFNSKKIAQRTISIVAAAAVLSGAAFAADVGGIRTNVKMWIDGQNETVTVEKTGKYSYTATTGDGEEKMFGGVSFDSDGNEQELSSEDMQDMYAVDVAESEDGTWTLTFFDRKIDITGDMENGGYHETLTHDGKQYEVVIKTDGSLYYNDVTDDSDSSDSDKMTVNVPDSDQKVVSITTGDD